MNPIWQEVWQVARSELTDLGDVRAVTQFCMRIGLAALLGAILGMEREWRGKSAGLRTHMLVSLGAALFVLAPMQAGMSLADASRVLQGLVAGIAFLGAGVIIKAHRENHIVGLTSAANIWLTASIGMACGLGREASAIVVTVLALLILAALPKVERKVVEPMRRGGGEADAGEDPQPGKGDDAAPGGHIDWSRYLGSEKGRPGRGPG